VAVQVEELADNKVRLKVDVPREDMQHAVEHATSDLAGSVKIPGFRPGKVPMQVLRARLGEERLLTEAVESHIGGWFWNAAASSRIQPIAQPQYEYDLPASDDDAWSFTATVDVQPKPELADWTRPPAATPRPTVGSSSGRTNVCSSSATRSRSATRSTPSATPMTSTARCM